MEEINAYIKNIAVFNVLMIFADFIMPDSFSKKYVSFILGIVLALTVIEPFMRLTDKEFDAERIIQSIENSPTEKHEYSDIVFESVFEENLKSDMENELEKAGIEFESIKADAVMDENGAYVLKDVKISADGENFDIAEKIISEKYAPENILPE